MNTWNSSGLFEAWHRSMSSNYAVAEKMRQMPENVLIVLNLIQITSSSPRVWRSLMKGLRTARSGWRRSRRWPRTRATEKWKLKSFAGELRFKMFRSRCQKIEPLQRNQGQTWDAIEDASLPEARTSRWLALASLSSLESGRIGSQTC